GDRRTYDLANRILIEKMEHETWFLEFLGGTSDALVRQEEVRSILERTSLIHEPQDQMWR
ncbi:MAG: hypothetical protein JW971_02875, partial [Synergistales bacterium]|nr:hypothetical protein [Synergistales bacterium]